MYSQIKIFNMKLKKMFTIIAMLIVVLMVGCKKEPSPVIYPKVTETYPAQDAIDIPIGDNISATFSTPMDSSTITVTSFTLQKGTEGVAGETSYSESIATFNPTANLEPNTVYLATITMEAKDEAGIGMESNYTFSFTSGATPDVTAPVITSINPLNNATNVAVNKAIELTFSEAIEPLTMNAATFTLMQGSVSVSGVVSYTGIKATFTPSGNLEYSKVYTGKVTTGVKDLASNALANEYTFSFTTAQAPDVTPPVVNSTDPLNNATGVAVNKVVAVTFSEALDPLTINATTFTLKQGATAVIGVVAYSGITATFTPANALETGIVYTATLTTGAKDLAGNAIAANTVISFTTAGAISNLAIVNLGAAGNYVILAKTAVNNTPTSAVTGDIGLSPAATSFITGFALTNATGYATSPQVTGNLYAADMTSPTGTNLTTAVENMITAYNDAAGRPSPDFSELATGNIGGKTLTKGLYKWTNTVSLPTGITISGSANDVWIFQIAGDLTVGAAVNVTLTGGAQAKNIFWQVAGQVTIGTTSHFEGIILSKTGITFQTGASINGRALAQTAVILDSNAVVKP